MSTIRNRPPIRIKPTAEPASAADGTIYFDQTLQKFLFRQDGVWKELLESNEINYITRSGITSNFEGEVTTGWNRYANTSAAATPEENAAGTPNVNVTFGTTTTDPVIEGVSGILTKDASNRQGEGIRTDWMTIDSLYDADGQGYLNGSFGVSTSANYVAGDLTVWIEADLGSSNYEIIPTTQRQIASGKYVHEFSFDTRNVLQYRLVLHIATTNADAWTAKFDAVVIGPRKGAVAVLDREELTMSLVGGTSPFTAGEIRIVRNGKSVTVEETERILFSSSAGADSGDQVIPQRFRPASNVGNFYWIQSNLGYRVDVRFDGVIGVTGYANSFGTSAITGTALSARWTLSYTIPDENYSPSANIDLVQAPSPFGREETFIPSFSGDAGNASGTMLYRKIGNNIIGKGVINWTGAGAASSLRIELPIEPANSFKSLTAPFLGSARMNPATALSGRGLGALLLSTGTINGKRTILITPENSDSASGIGSTRILNGNYFSSGGAIEFEFSYPIEEDPSYFGKFYAALPQRDYLIQGSNTTGLSNATNTDLTDGSIYLPKGRYVATISVRLLVIHSSVPTYILAGAILTDSSNSLVTGLGEGDTREAVSLSSSAGNSSRYQRTTPAFDWPGGVVKLRAWIDTTGGTITSRNVTNPTAHILRLQQ